jgi:hypothetical protein
VTDERETVSTHTDSRGDLVAVELPLLDFTVRRVFVVSGPPGGADRGNHLIPCEQLMVLIRGSATVRVDSDPDRPGDPIVLDHAGASLRLPAGKFVRYRLHDDSSAVMVLAEETYNRSPTS